VSAAEKAAVLSCVSSAKTVLRAAPEAGTRSERSSGVVTRPPLGRRRP
jgi:hypothetical protein